MNNLIITVFISLMITVFCQEQNVPTLLMDQSFIGKEINCILQRGSCDGIGRQIKALLPELLNDNCKRCTPVQKTNARKLIEFMQGRYPDEWRVILQMYQRSK